MPFTLRSKKIWVAGHRGLVGGAMMRALAREGCDDILTIARDKLDLRDQVATNSWVGREKPDAVILAAATVGGIGDNVARPFDYLYDNMMMETNVIKAALDHDVEKLLFLGSSCIYPRDAYQPISESALLTGPLELTNEAYAVAKIAGIKLCQAVQKQYGRSFIAAMPCNLYGPGDRFDLQRSHVIPALMLKMHDAKQRKADSVTIWGSGRPLREFLYVDDLAEALLILLRDYEGFDPVNVGSGAEISIAGLCAEIAHAVGFEGKIVYDSSRPDGVPRKVMDSKTMKSLGWNPSTDLREGLQHTYEWFLSSGHAMKNAA